MQTILVADDSYDDFLLLHRAFKKAEVNMALQWTRNGWEALEYLKGTESGPASSKNPKPVLAVIDLKMPLMDGYQLLTMIRSQPWTFQQMPCVIFTSSILETDAEQVYRLGANLFLTKPVTLQGYATIAKRIYELAIPVINFELQAPTALRKDPGFAR